MRLPRIRIGRSQSFFRLLAPTVERGQRGRIGNGFQYEYLQGWLA
jgi:hypothetical protein